MELQLVALPADHFDTWRDAARERMIARNRASGMRVSGDAAEHVDRMLTQMFGNGYPATQSEVPLIVDDEQELGSLLLWQSGSRMVILDAQLPDDIAGEHVRAVIELVRARAASAGADVVGIEAFAKDAVTAHLIEGGDWQSSSIQMILDPLPHRDDAGSIVSLRAMTPQRFEQYVSGSIDSFAAELMTAGKMTLAEAEAESRSQFDGYLPQGLESPGQFLHTAEVNGSEVGIVWFGAKPRGACTHAFILDIEIAVEHRGKGYGRESMLAAEREAGTLGMASMGLHVFATNAAAVALYENLGYERVQEYLVMDAC